jgi:hypothetical protein
MPFLSFHHSTKNAPRLSPPVQTVQDANLLILSLTTEKTRKEWGDCRSINTSVCGGRLREQNHEQASETS